MWGGYDRIGGLGAVVALGAVAMGGLAWLIAALAKTGRPVTTVAAVFGALAIGFPFWSPRPLLVGLLCLGLTVLVVERRRSPWWLLPIVWVWVNSHGSFPLGLVWLGATCAGTWIDARGNSDARSLAVPWRYLGSFVAGLGLGAVNPLGPRLLTFAASAVTKREVFANIVEWKPADFQSAEGMVCAAGIVVSVSILARHRVGWRYLLPTVGFLGMGLLAQRNLAPLGVVMAPTLAAAFRGDGTVVVGGAVVPRLHFVVAGALALVAGLLTVGGAMGPGLRVGTYPVASIDWLHDTGRFDAGRRVVAPDNVGNYVELRLGLERRRLHRRPRRHVSRRSFAGLRLLVARRASAVKVLDRYEADTLLWPRQSSLVRRLLATGEWRSAHTAAGLDRS